MHPGRLSDSLREYAAAIRLAFMRSGSRCVFPKRGIKGSSHGDYPKVAEKQKTPVDTKAARPGRVRGFWACAHPR